MRRQLRPGNRNGTSGKRRLTPALILIQKECDFMIVSGYYIRDTLFRMKTLQDKIDRIMRKTDMDEEALEEAFKDCQTKLYGICLDLLMGLAEATSTIDRYSSFKNTVELGFEMVKQAVKELKEADTLENLSGLIGPIVKQFENFQPEKYDAYDLRSDFRALFKWRHEALLDGSVIFAALKASSFPKEQSERSICLIAIQENILSTASEVPLATP